MKKFELSFIQEALDRLVAEGFTGVLVGGHAVNFWAFFYKQPTPEWDELLPYTSEDVDFLGGRPEALLCKRLFGGVSNLNDGTDPNIESIFELARNELGMRVYHRHGVEIEKALPLQAISAQPDERLQKFASVRLPQIVAQLKETRERYLASLSES